MDIYLMSLSEALKTHSHKELERTHHLIAVDNVLNICNNETFKIQKQAEINKITASNKKKVIGNILNLD